MQNYQKVVDKRKKQHLFLFMQQINIVFVTSKNIGFSENY